MHAFDTLKLAQRLRDEVKFSPEQAEKAASVLSDTFADWHGSQELASKADLSMAVISLKSDLETRLADLRGDLEIKLSENKTDIIKWVVGIGFAQVAMILAVLKIHT
jgi:hypothetical protein